MHPTGVPTFKKIDNFSCVLKKNKIRLKVYLYISSQTSFFRYQTFFSGRAYLKFLWVRKAMAKTKWLKWNQIDQTEQAHTRNAEKITILKCRSQNGKRYHSLNSNAVLRFCFNNIVNKGAFINDNRQVGGGAVVTLYEDVSKTPIDNG